MIFTDLATAVREHADLVQRAFGSAVATDENKFSALHYALWNRGTFVYVPRNVVDREAAAGGDRARRAGKQAGFHHTWW